MISRPGVSFPPVIASASQPASTPEVAVDRRAPSRAIVRWRFLAIGMYSVGALSVELFMALSLGDTGASWIGHGAALLFLALGLTTGLTAMRHYRPIVLVNAIGSILIVSALLAWAPSMEVLATFYTWPLLGAAYLLRRREVVGVGLLTTSTYAGALALGNDRFPTGAFLMVTVASAGVVLSVRILAEQLHRLVRALHTSSSTDPLTGLLNRRSFDRRFALTFQQALQEALPLSVLLLDLDHFKQVNDEYGHETGDRALVRFASLLQAQSRVGDLVARVGGEEFAVVLAGATVEQAQERAEQFAQTLRADRAIDDVLLTVSIGVSALERGDDTPTRLLQRADAAVYRAKREGRDRVVLVEAGGEVSVAERAG